jgi:hypothetical protein
MVFSFFNVFNYINNKTDLSSISAQLSKILIPDGVLILDLLNEDAMKLGSMSKTRQLTIKGQVYDYQQSMDVLSDRSMTFSETVSIGSTKVSSKTNNLKLWNLSELKEVIGKYLHYQSVIESKYLSHNQIRLCFKKED